MATPTNSNITIPQAVFEAARSQLNRYLESEATDEVRGHFSNTVARLNAESFWPLLLSRGTRSTRRELYRNLGPLKGHRGTFRLLGNSLLCPELLVGIGEYQPTKQRMRDHLNGVLAGVDQVEASCHLMINLVVSSSPLTYGGIIQLKPLFKAVRAVEFSLQITSDRVYSSDPAKRAWSVCFVSNKKGWDELGKRKLGTKFFAYFVSVVMDDNGVAQVAASGLAMATAINPEGRPASF